MRFTQTCVMLGVLAAPALASAQQIKQPGNHPLYSVELEPHLVVQYNDYAPCSEDAFGPGFRAAIPFLANGPLPRINNSMAIGFGLDFAHAGVNNGCYVFNNVNYGNGFSADVWTVPVVVQWNFFLLPKISVFGEGGIVFEHQTWDSGYFGNACGNGAFCNASGSNNTVEPSVSAGGRFLISDSVGFLLRIGYPYLSAGVSILL